MDATLRGLAEVPPPVGDVPLEVRKAIWRGLQSDRDARYADLRQLLAVLDTARGRAKPKRTEHWSSQPGRWSRSRPS